MEIQEVIDIKIHNEDIDKYVYIELSNILQKQLLEFNKNFSTLSDKVNDLLSEKWVYFKDKDVYYHHSIQALLPNFNNFEVGCCYTNSSFDTSSLKTTFNGFNGRIINHTELKMILDENYEVNCIDEAEYYTVSSNGYCWVEKRYINDVTRFNSYASGAVAYNIPIYKIGEDGIEYNSKDIIALWIKNELFPSNLVNLEQDTYMSLLHNYKRGFIEINEKNIIKFKTDKIIKHLEVKDNYFYINGIKISYEMAVQKIHKRGYIDIKGSYKDIIYTELLNCETIRADIEQYDERILTDPNRGHWDLWNSQLETGITLKLDEKVIARNPVLDIKEDGIIGIDFGTKSTIVVYQDNNVNTLPMRVGMGNYSKKIESKHYENPTVIEFINIEQFLNKYNQKLGRPNTEWEDLTISHTAFNNLMVSSSEHYYSFLNELKQWAGDKERKIKLRDKQGVEKILGIYTELSDNDFDPIEIYAYFLGLYINNMHNGIYLDYVLSFPVTYEKMVREKILDSFNRGLKKSLPESLLKNEEIISKFRVQAGASEPAAYAICALEEYKFKLEDNDKIFYGVFDFGGGTTDFDFGVWRESRGIEKRRFDYVIEHFGAGGDQYLGGENLLELLAFEIFKVNQDNLRESGITFILPPECFKFPGSEVLISDSQEARLNTRQVMEKLRPFWERHDNYEVEFEKGIIQLNLFSKTGELNLNFELEIDLDMLHEILIKRVEKGVVNFFEALKLSFKHCGYTNIEEVKILLAGNSSKADIVKELFKEYISKETQLINKEFNHDKSYFTVYSALGTEDAIKIQGGTDSFNIERPTGKTGVAFGLIKSRAGGRIKVIDKNIKDTEIRFKYYLGYESKGKFISVIDRELEYGKWELFVDAYYEDFEIYYTNLPQASTNNMNISDVLRKKCRLSSTFETANVYIRTISPTVIEYVVAEEEKINEGEYLSGITQINLG